MRVLCACAPGDCPVISPQTIESAPAVIASDTSCCMAMSVSAAWVAQHHSASAVVLVTPGSSRRTPTSLVPSLPRSGWQVNSVRLSVRAQCGSWTGTGRRRGRE